MRTCGWVAVAVSAVLLTSTQARADDTVQLRVETGTPLRVALDQRVTVHHVGQLVAGTLVDPLYAYDRIVIPAGAVVTGRIAALQPEGRWARLRTIASGSFSRQRTVVLIFESIGMPDGRAIPIHALVTQAVSRVDRQVAQQPDAEKQGPVARARAEAEQRAKDALAVLKQPGKMDRLKAAAIDQLPYHPQFLTKGTTYTAELAAPLDFGTVAGADHAPSGSTPAPDSILTARLVAALDSSKTPRGAPVEAIVSEPVFSSDHALILAAGARLHGEVTFAKAARRLHRNGQLRFLFERIDAPELESRTLQASLYSVQTNAADHVAVDDEGGTKISESKTRFIAPALTVLALRGAIGRDHHHFDDDGDDVGGVAPPPSSHGGALGLGGFFGFGLIGAALGPVSRPLGIGLAVVGASRSIYRTFLGRGHDVTFAADTPIQVQLAPGPTAGPPVRR